MLINFTAQFTFWAAISPIDIITELIICVLPIYIVQPVQVVIGKKIAVVVAFVFRFLYVQIPAANVMVLI